VRELARERPFVGDAISTPIYDTAMALLLESEAIVQQLAAKKAAEASKLIRP
jgi:hypothetical protein